MWGLAGSTRWHCVSLYRRADGAVRTGGSWPLYISMCKNFVFGGFRAGFLGWIVTEEGVRKRSVSCFQIWCQRRCRGCASKFGDRCGQTRSLGLQNAFSLERRVLSLMNGANFSEIGSAVSPQRLVQYGYFGLLGASVEQFCATEFIIFIFFIPGEVPSCLLPPFFPNLLLVMALCQSPKVRSSVPQNAVARTVKRGCV